MYGSAEVFDIIQGRKESAGAVSHHPPAWSPDVRRSGDVSTLSIPLRSHKHQGLSTLIDAIDHELVAPYKWYPWPRKEGGFYVVAGFEGTTLLMHRVVMNAQPGEIVDHKNGDGLDNRRSTNLRITNYSGNRANTGLRGNRTGLKGVESKRGRWNARIEKQGKVFWLGTFDSPIEAAVAYDRAAVELFGELSATNESLGLIDAFLAREQKVGE